MSDFITTETLIIELLLIVSLVAIAVRRLRIPYTVALVVVGLLITFQSPLQIDLTPELILTLFVPPLAFEAAFHINYDDLRGNFGALLFLAIPGVILTTLIVGGILYLGTPLALPVALVFGSLIAATDPLAVVSLFRTLGVPKRLAVLVEGESLFNDGTAIVVFNLMLVVALANRFDPMESISNFLRVSIGGIVVGLILGWMVAVLISRLDEYLIEITLTTVLAFGAYLVAERLHFSGVLAVVVAGLINGNIGSRGMSPTTRIILYNFWEYVAFLVNSLVFLLIGLDVNIPALIENWQLVLWAIMAILVARLLIVYGLGWLNNRFTEPIPLRWQHVLYWGGLRGAICLALALSLPVALGIDRENLRVMAFGVVLFTLMVQSLTMRPLIQRLHIITRSEAQIEYELRHARLTALRAADARLDRLHSEGLLSAITWEQLKKYVNQRANSLANAMHELLMTDPALEAEQLDTGWRELFRAQRSALLGLRRDGVISMDIYESLTAEIDSWIAEGYPTMPTGGETRTRFLETIIPTDAYAVGKLVSELGIPRAAILVSIRRGEDILIPRGDTRLRSGDVVTTLCEEESVQEVRDTFLAPTSPKKNSELPSANTKPNTDVNNNVDLDSSSRIN